jgi:hypothetical protein
VAGRAGEEYFLLDIDDVLAFQAEREIVWIVTARQRYMATQPLHKIDARLKGSVFQRVHRNALVNVNHVRKMSSLSSQRWLLTLSNGQEFIVSKRWPAASGRCCNGEGAGLTASWRPHPPPERRPGSSSTSGGCSGNWRSSGCNRRDSAGC